MSFGPDSTTPNPFQSPRKAPAYVAAQSRLPVFCTVMFIIDLFFCALRLILVGFGFYSLQLAANGQNPIITETGMFEVATGLAMVLFGVPANVVMLMKQPWGAFLAYVKIVANLASLGVGIWQLTYFLETVPEGSPERIGMLFGSVIATVFRLALIAVYGAAVLKFSMWARGRPENHQFDAPPPDFSQLS